VFPLLFFKRISDIHDEEYEAATMLQCENIKATIWQNVSENGPFFATIFS